MSYRIGASEIAGLVKHYALHNKFGTQSQEIYNKINVDYLPSYYEHACLFKLTEEERNLYKLYRKTHKSKAMARGNEMEDMVMQDYVGDKKYILRSIQEVRNKEIFYGLNYRATIDYVINLDFDFIDQRYPVIVKDNCVILECKTTNPFTFQNLSKEEPPFHYWIQVQMQMYLHEIYDAVIHIAGIKQDDKKPIIYDSNTYKIKYDVNFINDIIINTGLLFIEDMKNNTQYDIIKTKRDNDLDNFLEMLLHNDIVIIDKETCELPINDFITLKEHYETYSTLEKQIKSAIKDKSQSMIFIPNGDKTVLCKKSKVNYHTQETIDKTIKDLQQRLEEAQNIKIGDKVREASILISIL